LPALRSARWHDGLAAAPDASGEADLTWTTPQGQPMTPADWEHGAAGALQARFAGAGGPSVLLLFNPTPHECRMTLPGLPSSTWVTRLRSDAAASSARPLELSQSVTLPPRCLWVAMSRA
jgi:pullulanase/glycogen debranching enzyme